MAQHKGTSRGTVKAYDAAPKVIPTPTPTKAPENEIVVSQANGLIIPQELRDLVKENEGLGLSYNPDDSIVPLVYILQDKSPQTEKRSSEYIPGAEPGDIWLRNSLFPIVKGEQGIIVQPCYFTKNVVEWIPRKAGGGFVAIHDEMPNYAIEVEKEARNGKLKTVFVTKDGHELVPTRYHYVLLNGVPYVIPFTSTGNKISRDWMQLMQGIVVDGRQSPTFMHKYLLRTVFKQDGSYSWFMWNVSYLGTVSTVEEFYKGKKFFEAAAKNEKIAEMPISMTTVDEQQHDDAQEKVNETAAKLIGEEIPF